MTVAARDGDSPGIRRIPFVISRRSFAVVLSLWLALVGALIWRHASESVWPPIYDAYTYFYKARYVWEAFDAGVFGLDRLLAIEPSFRPFGTILVSYPFGFSSDFRGFYFRSTFFPVVLVCVAAFIGSWRTGQSRRYTALAALTACFLSTLSLFFYFELYTGGPPAVSNWGLVDGFLTGLAALGMAAALRSVLRRSVGWAVVSVLTLLVAIFVKPSGLVIAAICGAILGAGWAWTLKEDWPTPRRGATLRRCAWVAAIEVVVLGGGALVALSSAYLGATNLTYGNAAIDVMRSELRIDWLTQIRIAKDGLGIFVPAWLIATAVVWTRRRVSRPTARTAASRVEDLMMALAAATLLGGVWFWIFQSGGRTLVRYFAPFLYVAIFCALPFLLTALDESRAVVRRTVSLLMAGTVANLVLLLALPDPPLTWQAWSAVNVKSGTRPASIVQAQSLLALPHAPGASPVNVYSFVQGIPDAMFESVFDLHALAGATPRYTVRRPVDWQRPTVFRIEEIVSSDYLLVDPAIVEESLPRAIDTLLDERFAFSTWANHATSEDGVERVSAEPDSLLLRISDRDRMRRSLGRLVAAHRWRGLFLEENPQKWWSDAAIRERTARAVDASRIDDVDFAGLIRMRQVLLSPAPGGALELEVWLRSGPQLAGDDWAMLVHVLDADHQPLENRDVSLGSIEKAPSDDPYWLVKTKFVPPKGARFVAIGIYRGAVVLSADKGETDWNGKRILLPVPTSRAGSGS